MRLTSVDAMQNQPKDTPTATTPMPAISDTSGFPGIPGNIAKFIAGCHVLSIAAHDAGELWCASCFYAFDASAARLIILTSAESRHGRLMLRQPQVAGTIAGQPAHIRAIRGLQFCGHAECLTPEAARKEALERYAEAHPIARFSQSHVWAIWLEQMKYTDNQWMFAQKTYWCRTAS